MPTATRPVRQGASATAGVSRRLDKYTLGIFDLCVERFARRRALGEPLHHQCVSRGTQQIVVLLNNLAVLAVIQAKLLQPIIEVFENFPSAGLHPDQHVRNASLDANAGWLAVE